MPYLPALITNLTKCPQCGLVENGRILELRGPGQKGLSEEQWQNKPKGFSAYHCGRCGLLWFKHPRRVKEEIITVGFHR
jgi:ribosomal protein S27AE